MILQMAVRALLDHRRQTMLLALALSTVTFLCTVMLSLAGGLRSAVFDATTRIFTGHVNVEGFYKVTRGRTLPVLNDAGKLEALIRQAVPESTSIARRFRTSLAVTSGTGTVSAFLMGVDIASDPRMNGALRPKAGHVEELREPGTAVLFERVATRLGVGVGDVLTLVAPSLTGVYNTADVRVVAVTEDIGDFTAEMVILHHDTLRRLLQFGGDTTAMFYIYLPDPDSPDDALLRLRTALESAGYQVLPTFEEPSWQMVQQFSREPWTGGRIGLSTWRTAVPYVTWVLTALNSLTALFTALLLSIVVAGMMNTLWLAIRERTREIGTMRALGMQRGMVVRLFVTQAFLISLGGTALGLLAGIAFSALANTIGIPAPEIARSVLLRDQLLFDPRLATLIPAALVVVFVTTSLAAIPSLRAARISPVVAMQ